MKNDPILVRKARQQIINKHRSEEIDNLMPIMWDSDPENLSPN